MLTDLLPNILIVAIVVFSLIQFALAMMLHTDPKEPKPSSIQDEILRDTMRDAANKAYREAESWTTGVVADKIVVGPYAAWGASRSSEVPDNTPDPDTNVYMMLARMRMEVRNDNLRRNRCHYCQSWLVPKKQRTESVDLPDNCPQCGAPT